MESAENQYLFDVILGGVNSLKTIRAAEQQIVIATGSELEAAKIDRAYALLVLGIGCVTDKVLQQQLIRNVQPSYELVEKYKSDPASAVGLRFAKEDFFNLAGVYVYEEVNNRLCYVGFGSIVDFRQNLISYLKIDCTVSKTNYRRFSWAYNIAVLFS